MPYLGQPNLLLGTWHAQIALFQWIAIRAAGENRPFGEKIVI